MSEKDRMKVWNDITLILANFVRARRYIPRQELGGFGPIPSEEWLDLDPRNVESISWMALPNSHLGDVRIFAKYASRKHFAKPFNRKTTPITEQTQTINATLDQVKSRLFIFLKVDRNNHILHPRGVQAHYDKQPFLNSFWFLNRPPPFIIIIYINIFDKPVLCSALSNSLFSFSLSLKHPRLFIAW